jgi:hypothetical protein
MPLEEKAFVRATTPSRYLQELTRSLLKIKHAKKYADSRVVFLAHFVIKKPVIQAGLFFAYFHSIKSRKEPVQSACCPSIKAGMQQNI